MCNLLAGWLKRGLMKGRKWSRGWWVVGGCCLERKEKTKRREKKKKGWGVANGQCGSVSVRSRRVRVRFQWFQCGSLPTANYAGKLRFSFGFQWECFQVVILWILFFIIFIINDWLSDYCLAFIIAERLSRISGIPAKSIQLKTFSGFFRISMDSLRLFGDSTPCLETLTDSLKRFQIIGILG